jgi:hypothetical protein
VRPEALKASGYRRASPGGASRAAVVWLTATSNYRVPFTLPGSPFSVRVQVRFRDFEHVNTNREARSEKREV